MYRYMRYLKCKSGEQEDFRMRYLVCVEDIKFVKNRQWSITYYLLLLYAGIVYVAYVFQGKLSLNNNPIISVMIVLTLGAFIVGVYLHCEFYGDILRYRRNMREAAKYLTSEFQKYESHEKGKNYLSWNRDIGYPIFFILLLLAGAEISFSCMCLFLIGSTEYLFFVLKYMIYGAMATIVFHIIYKWLEKKIRNERS